MEILGHILLFGCGYVASRLAEICLAAGRPVSTVRRSPHFPEGVAGIVHDLVSGPIALASAPDAAVFSVSADSHSEAAYRAAYVEALRNALTSLERASFRGRFLFVSSTGVYGQDAGEIVDEASPTESSHFSGRVLLEAEAMVRSSGLDAIVVRFSGIYGPGRTRLIDEVRAGRAVRHPSAQFTNRIHRDDCAAMLQFLLDSQHPHRVYVGTDTEASDKSEVFRWLADAMGMPEPPLVPGPANVSGKRCSSARIQAEGFKFKYPTFREGYAELLR